MKVYNVKITDESLQMDGITAVSVSGILTLREYSTEVGGPKFRHPTKVYYVKLMGESCLTDGITADSVRGILALREYSAYINWP